MATSVEERFLRFVEKTENDWLWTGATAGTGAHYGQFYAQGKYQYAHRVAYTLWVGTIPDGLVIDHVRARGCQSTLCVNPAHLEAVTQVENQRRIRLRVCRAGLHDLTDDANVRWDSQGRRRGCRLCWNARERERYKRKG